MRNKKDATVALSGESADEVFGGYPWFHQEELLYVDKFPWLTNWKNTSPLLLNEVSNQCNLENYIDTRFQEAILEVPTLEGKVKIRETTPNVLFILTRFLPFLLDRKDRMSMAVGFEVRVPFCDYRLVEYLWNVPFNIKSIDNIEKAFYVEHYNQLYLTMYVIEEKALIQLHKIHTTYKQSVI